VTRHPRVKAVKAPDMSSDFLARQLIAKTMGRKIATNHRNGDCTSEDPSERKEEGDEVADEAMIHKIRDTGITVAKIETRTNARL